MRPQEKRSLVLIPKRKKLYQQKEKSMSKKQLKKRFLFTFYLRYLEMKKEKKKIGQYTKEEPLPFHKLQDNVQVFKRKKEKEKEREQKKLEVETSQSSPFFSFLQHLLVVLYYTFSVPFLLASYSSFSFFCFPFFYLFFLSVSFLFFFGSFGTLLIPFCFLFFPFVFFLPFFHSIY